MSSAITDEVLRLRNAVKEGAYKRLVSAFLARAAVDAKGSAASEQEVEQAENELAQAVDAQVLVLQKQSTMCATYQRDQAGATERQAQAEHGTHTTQLEIRELVTRLEKERVLRNNKEEYAALAKLIQTLPPRHVVEAEVRELEAQRDALAAHARLLEQRRVHRERQFSVLLHAVADLQAQLDEETNAATAAAVDSAAGAGAGAVGVAGVVSGDERMLED